MIRTHRPTATVLASLGFLLVASSCSTTEMLDESRQATGVKVGEVTDTSAIIWMRVTKNEKRRGDGVVRRDRAKRAVPPEFPDPNDLEGSVPGAVGQVRVRYSTDESALDDPQNGFGHPVGNFQSEPVDLVVDALGPQHFIFGLHVGVLQRDEKREDAARSETIRHEETGPLVKSQV